MKFITKLYYNLFHKEITQKLKEIKKIEFDHEYANIRQLKKLYEILDYSIKNVPFYQRFNTELNEASKDDPVSLLQKIPTLDKPILNEHFEKLKTIREDILSTSYDNFSGGSTGVPTKFLYDPYFMSSFSAWKIYCDSFIKKFPPKILRLWGDQNPILKNRGFKKKIRDTIHNTKSINAFNINETTAIDFINMVDSFKPDIVEAYVDALYNLTSILKKKNLSPVNTNYGVITSAGTLYPHMKEQIEDVLGVKVFNRYGSREVGPIAISCEKGNLHVNNYYLFVEVLKDDLSSCKPGETGKAHVTTLDNFSMPLIRYNLGDFATLSSTESCSCGRTGMILSKLDGRESTFIKTKNGDVISGLFFVHFFGVVHSNGSIKNFQIVQNSLEELEVKVVVTDKNNFLAAKENIEKSILRLVSNQMTIHWSEVDEIPSLKSGKYVYVVNNLT